MLNRPGLAAYFDDEHEIRDAYWLVEPGQVAIDVGSAEGSYTLPALLNGARVYAVEPFAERLATLRECAFEAGADVNLLTVVHGALFDGTPLPEDLLHDLREAAPVTSDMAPPPGSEFSTLDDLVDLYRMVRLDWIKVDVEGAELGVLRGGQAALSRFHPTLIIEDHTLFYPHMQNGDSARAMGALLVGLGYRIDRLPYEGPTSGPRLMWVCTHESRS